MTGERSLRRLLIIGANSVIIKRHVHPLARPGTWLNGMLLRKPPMLVRVALANIPLTHASMCCRAVDGADLRQFIADDLEATAQIKQNPSRTAKQPTDWTLYKERHLVECFFNRIKRFRRIALRCEKTVSSFRAFVSLACTMVWLAYMKMPPSPSSAIGVEA